jgi:hypothetical protein
LEKTTLFAREIYARKIKKKLFAREIYARENKEASFARMFLRICARRIFNRFAS